MERAMSSTTEIAQNTRAHWIRGRWPTAAAIVVAALTAYGLTEGAELAPILAVSGLIYLGAAALRRPAAAWPLFLVAMVVLTAFKVLDRSAAPTWIFLGLAVLFIGYGLVRGTIRPTGGLPLQTLAMAVVGAIAVITLRIDATAGGILVAIGLLGHAGWDVYHHRVNRVVVRSLAEFCFVIDTLVAGAMLAVVAS
jgi:hypothetical protein